MIGQWLPGQWLLGQWLLGMGAAIFGVLGTAHLALTFLTNRFESSDPAVSDAMRQSSPRLTAQTSMWRAWVGFNASHSIGALVFSVIYLYLAAFAYEFVSTSDFLLGLPVLVGIVYTSLAYRYWFRVPLAGLSVATLCFAGSLALHLAT